MIDTYLRTTYQENLVDPVVRLIIRSGISSHAVTLFALFLGICIVPALVYGMPVLAVLFLMLSGYCDTLDGSLARAKKEDSPRGAVLDIVSDRIVEFLIILGLFLVDPVDRGLVSLLMVGSVLICVTSFLVVGIFLENEGQKSFHYSPGIMERSEAFLFFGMMILFPAYFGILGLCFAALVSLTGLIRVAQFYCA